MKGWSFFFLFSCTLVFLPVSTHAARLSNYKGWEKVEVLATAYCPCSKCCGKHANGVTAIGNNAYTKGVAVDRSIIPLKSTVKIPGYGIVTADDVGGAIKRNRIDVRFNSHKKALKWGRQTLVVYYKTP